MDPTSQLLMFAFVAVGLLGCSLASKKLAMNGGERREVMARPGTSRLGSDHTTVGGRMTLARASRYPESQGAPR